MIIENLKHICPSKVDLARIKQKKQMLEYFIFEEYDPVRKKQKSHSKYQTLKNTFLQKQLFSKQRPMEKTNTILISDFFLEKPRKRERRGGGERA